MVLDVSGTPLVAVCICTRNNASALAKWLPQVVLACEQTPVAVELIVVDNGSSDGTDAVLTDVLGAGSARKGRVIREPEAGLSHARNSLHVRPPLGSSCSLMTMLKFMPAGCRI